MASLGLNRISILLVAALAVVSSPAAEVSWRNALVQAADWYRSDDAAALAESVIAYQTPHGGWPKNIDFSKPPTDRFHALREVDRAPTIDNGGTTTPLHFLARVIHARPNHDYVSAVNRGLDYLMDSQYESGGFPQYFPLRAGYYSHITYNDDAMINVLTLLRDVSIGKQTTFDFVDDARAERARRAVERGIECILRTQVRQEGKPTGWCAQHDPKTFAPAWARNFEPPSLSGHETVGIVRFLMSIESPSPEITAAIHGAVEWLRAVAVTGLRVEDFTADDGKRDRRAVPDAKARPLWARFYELGTNRPIFAGRDKIIRYDFNAIERERRTLYSYLGTWPAKLLRDEYPRWLQRHGDREKSAAVK